MNMASARLSVVFRVGPKSTYAISVASNANVCGYSSSFNGLTVDIYLHSNYMNFERIHQSIRKIHILRLCRIDKRHNDYVRYL